MRANKFVSVLGFLFFSTSALAAKPCARAYVPEAEQGSFLQQRLLGDGVKLSAGSEEQAWNDLVVSFQLQDETKDFDLVEQHVLLRRLEKISVPELAKLYPSISKAKLKKAKARVNPCSV